MFTVVMIIDTIDHHLQQYFSKETHPLNLGIFRIVLFATILWFTNFEAIVSMSTLPESIRVAPEWYEFFFDYIPFDHSIVAISGIVFRVSCIMAMLGLGTHTAIPISLLSGIYFLGIPQFFGKINHNHHFIWFILLLLFARSGDAISLDFLIRKYVKKSKPTLAVAKIYALPLRYVWLLIGVIYFFPGYWKLHAAGLDWIVGDNIRNILHWKWMELGTFTPFFRLDNYPLLYRLAGAMTIFFELGFLLCITTRRLRPLAWISGILFHLSTKLFMNIGFMTLIPCYVAFIDWHRFIGIHKTDSFSSSNTHRYRKNIIAIHCIGTILLGINIYCGFSLKDSWPVGVYPTFAAKFPDAIWQIDVVPNNDIQPPTLQESWNLFGGPPRWTAKQQQLLSTGDPDLCLGIWTSYTQRYPRFEQSTEVVIDGILVSTDPDKKQTPPLSRNPICIIQKTGEAWPLPLQ